MKYQAQEKWQQKVGLISKSYKLSKDLVNEFKKACEERGETQANVLSKLMRRYIDDTK